MLVLMCLCALHLFVFSVSHRLHTFGNDGRRSLLICRSPCYCTWRKWLTLCSPHARQSTMCRRRFQRRNKTRGLGNFHFDWLSNTHSHTWHTWIHLEVLLMQKIYNPLFISLCALCSALRMSVAFLFLSAANLFPTSYDGRKSDFSCLTFHQIQCFRSYI